MKKLNNKGFTLIEIVIVIVIIAILAAMLVPSLTAWIDKANKKTFLSAANEIKMATTSYITENYDKTYATQTDITDTEWTAIGELANATVSAGTPSAGNYQVAFTATGNKITSFTVTNTKYTVEFDGTDWDDVESVS